MNGDALATSIQSLEQAGACIVGANCSMTSSEIYEVAHQVRQATSAPVLIRPNAGNPIFKDGVTYYQQTPEEFAKDMVRIHNLGVECLGGCCGTTPHFIQQLVNALAST